MDKRRTIHDKTRTTPYRIKLGDVVEDVHIIIDDESGNVYYDTVISKERLNGVSDLHFCFANGQVIWNSKSAAIVSGTKTPCLQKASTPKKTSRGRTDSDEYYVIGLCDEILGEEASHQHTFDFLRGDTGVKLNVDAYYASKNLVVEYCESQHTEATPFFDHNERLTRSGVTRGEQRRIYDQRRRELIPLHGISFIEIHYSDFGTSKKIRRNHDHDIKVIQNIFKTNGII